MDPITAAAVTGAVGGIGESLISGIGQYAANRSNRRAADRQMAWQERMSSTAYQRSVQDMQKAGLNSLYWLKGGGASTPGGSMSRSESVAEGIRGTTARALEARFAAANVRNFEAQNAQLLSQASYNLAAAKEVAARTAKITAGLDRTSVDRSIAAIKSNIVEKTMEALQSGPGQVKGEGPKFGFKKVKKWPWEK